MSSITITMAALATQFNWSALTSLVIFVATIQFFPRLLADPEVITLWVLHLAGIPSCESPSSHNDLTSTPSFPGHFDYDKLVLEPRARALEAERDAEQLREARRAALLQAQYELEELQRRHRRQMEEEEARDLERALELSRQEEQRRMAQSAEARTRLSRPTFRTLVLRDPQPPRMPERRYGYTFAPVPQRIPSWPSRTSRFFATPAPVAAAPVYLPPFTAAVELAPAPLPAVDFIPVAQPFVPVPAPAPIATFNFFPSAPAPPAVEIAPAVFEVSDASMEMDIDEPPAYPTDTGATGTEDLEWDKMDIDGPEYSLASAFNYGLQVGMSMAAMNDVEVVDMMMHTEMNAVQDMGDVSMELEAADEEMEIEACLTQTPQWTPVGQAPSLPPTYHSTAPAPSLPVQATPTPAPSAFIPTQPVCAPPTSFFQLPVQQAMSFNPVPVPNYSLPPPPSAPAPLPSASPFKRVTPTRSTDRVSKQIFSRPAASMENAYPVRMDMPPPATVQASTPLPSSNTSTAFSRPSVPVGVAQLLARVSAPAEDDENGRAQRAQVFNKRTRMDDPDAGSSSTFAAPPSFPAPMVPVAVVPPAVVFSAGQSVKTQQQEDDEVIAAAEAMQKAYDDEVANLANAPIVPAGPTEEQLEIKRELARRKKERQKARRR